ncbi:MAG: glycosyltransferase family 4 protein [Candidatus Eisenbacteria bacterium]|nr:glycosyltransferase family 4 protein [Candidatus Eisenbacteria bacterium]
MKFVQLITRLVRGGAQRVALETAVDLAARGHEVELWAGIETGAEGSLWAEARARGVTVREVPHLRRAVAPLHDFAATAWLHRALRDIAPDWLHTHSSKAGIVGREAARRAGLRRVAHTVHGFGFTPRTSWIARDLFIRAERRAATVTDLLIFVAEADRRTAAGLGLVPRGRALLVPPGIDLVPFEDLVRLRAEGEARRRALGISPDDVVLGFLGRMAAQKNPEALIPLWNRVRAAEPARSLRLLMVGDGPQRTELEGMTDSGALWVGRQEDPVPWLAAMDLVLLPSLWEGAPLTVMEAMAAGREIVASDLPGIRGLLDHGVEGQLVAPTDRDAWVSAVQAQLARVGAARRAGAETASGQAARRRALASFGRDQMLARLRELYATGAR